MEIEFDPAKRAFALKARKLDMARAGEVFEAEHLTRTDLRRDYGEERYFTVGFLDGRMVTVAWTWRGDVLRVISMRKANEREQRRLGPLLGR